MASTNTWSIEYRNSHPESNEARICRNLQDNLTSQTHLVEDALKSGLFNHSDITIVTEKSVVGEDQAFPEIFEWAHFRGASDEDRRRLEDANIPYLANEYGTWIGLTSFGSAWDLYIIPELAEALYG